MVDRSRLTTTATVPVVADLTFNHARGPDVHGVVAATRDGERRCDRPGHVQPDGAFTGRDQFTVQACSVLEPTNCGTAVVTVTVCPSRAGTQRWWGRRQRRRPGRTNDVGAVGPRRTCPTRPRDGGGGDASVRYTPDPGFVGTDSFTYTICSTTDVDVCAIATVDVTVTAPPNQPPTAQDATSPTRRRPGVRQVVSDPDFEPG